MSATGKPTAVPPATNLLSYLSYLEQANQYHALQLDRAAAEIRSLRTELARARGHLIIGPVAS